LKRFNKSLHINPPNSNINQGNAFREMMRKAALFFAFGFAATFGWGEPIPLGPVEFAFSGQKEELRLLASDRILDFRIDFTVKPNAGVWGLVFNYLDDEHYCLVNFYPQKGKIYYYQKIKGRFIEAHHTEWRPSGNPFIVEKQAANLLVKNGDQEFRFTEPYFQAGGIGFHTEGTATTITVESFQPFSLLEESQTAFNEEKFLGEYLPKMEPTKLFYDFSQPPQDFHFCQIRGRTRCEWKDEALEFSFVDRLDTWMVFNKDVSGYEGLLLEGGFSSAGRIQLEMTDVFDRSFTWESTIESSGRKIQIPFAELVGENGDCLTTLNTLKIRYDPDVKQQRQTYRLRGIRPMGGQPMDGPWIAVDPLFAYYRFSPWQRTARALKRFGFRGAEIVIIKDEPGIDGQREIVEAFHKEGLLSILRIYPTTDFDAFRDHPDWRQVTLDGSSQFDWRVYLCPNSSEFTEFISAKINAILESVPYDALELAEPWFEIWGGPYPDNPRRGKYACLCENCRRKFKALAGTDPRELFQEESPSWFLKDENQALYQKWQDFRVDTMIDFSRKIFEAAKQVRPDLKIVHMHLSDCTVEPGRVREYQALDFEKAIQVLHPDALILEDAWQDWEKPDTQPDFVVAYGNYYLERIRKASPRIKVFAHADIGSLAQMQRTHRWMRAFSAHAHQAGFDGVDYYEFTTGDFSQ